MASDDATVRFIQAYSRFINHLWEAGRRLNQAYDISGPQMGILRLVEHLGPCSLGDLQKMTAGHLSALGQKVDRLEDGGWLERHRNAEDRRKLELRLTARARQMLKKERLIGPARVMNEMASMSAAEARRVASAMELVTEMMIGDDEGDEGNKS